MPKLRNSSKGDSNPALLIASPAYYDRAIALQRSGRSLVERMDAMETTYQGRHMSAMRREGGGLIASR